MKQFNYSADADLLYVYSPYEQGEQFKENIDTGSLVLDMSSKGKVRGVEIFDASQFLRNFAQGLDAEAARQLLVTLVAADFDASVRPEGVLVSFRLHGATADVPGTVAVPLEVRTR